VQAVAMLLPQPIRWKKRRCRVDNTQTSVPTPGNPVIPQRRCPKRLAPSAFRRGTKPRSWRQRKTRPPRTRRLSKLPGGSLSARDETRIELLTAKYQRGTFFTRRGRPAKRRPEPLLLKGIEDSLAELGHIRTQLVRIFFKRERGIGVEQVDAIAPPSGRSGRDSYRPAPRQSVAPPKVCVNS